MIMLLVHFRGFYNGLELWGLARNGKLIFVIFWVPLGILWDPQRPFLGRLGQINQARGHSAAARQARAQSAAARQTREPSAAAPKKILEFEQGPLNFFRGLKRFVSGSRDPWTFSDFFHQNFPEFSHFSTHMISNKKN